MGGPTISGQLGGETLPPDRHRIYSAAGELSRSPCPSAEARGELGRSDVLASGQGLGQAEHFSRDKERSRRSGGGATGSRLPLLEGENGSEVAGTYK